MASLSSWGNDLYTGKRSYDFVGKRHIWYAISGVLIILSIILPIARGGFNFGIDFRGGDEFRISSVDISELDKATAAVESVLGSDEAPQTTAIGTNVIRVQTEPLTSDQSDQVRDALAAAFGQNPSDISPSRIDAKWGGDVTQQAIQALVVFLILVTAAMWIYFRTWKMSVAALIALLHDLIITAGIYGATGFEVTPATVIGYLTILGYSLYDTVVVFDKVRETTKDYANNSALTYVESVNLAVNQTLVRSINTSVVALLPVISILVIGGLIMGASTLADISLALLIGITVGAYSSIFIASPLYAHLRDREPEIVKQSKHVLSLRATASE